MFKRLGKQLLAGPYLIWIIGFILLPLFMILYYALCDTTGQFTLHNLCAIVDPIHRKALFLSIRLAMIATFFCFVLAYPLAMILTKLPARNQNFIVFLFILPMWMNFMLRILAWKLILAPTGILNIVLAFFHLPAVNILNTPTAIVMGMVYEFLPFMILPIYNSMSRISTDIIEAAQDLGASFLTTFCKILFPLTLSGVISGIVMVFVPALTSFVVSELLGGGKTLLIGNVIEQEFMQSMDWHLGSGLSIVLMIFVLLSMKFMNRKDMEDTAIW